MSAIATPVGALLNSKRTILLGIPTLTLGLKGFIRQIGVNALLGLVMLRLLIAHTLQDRALAKPVQSAIAPSEYR